MGWAKYYEDNVSIINDRFAMRETEQVHCYKVEVIKVQIVEKKKPIKKASKPKKAEKDNSRKGLELTFIVIPNKKISRMLQMNGWWWSTTKGCWCNGNTEANRKYAENTVRTYGAQLKIVAA